MFNVDFVHILHIRLNKKQSWKLNTKQLKKSIRHPRKVQLRVKHSILLIPSVALSLVSQTTLFKKNKLSSALNRNSCKFSELYLYKTKCTVTLIFLFVTTYCSTCFI